jgi:putative endonuclease
MMTRQKSLGGKGEEEASAYLAKRGYTILERSFRTRSGEIDIIAEKAGTIAFVEVKTRVSTTYGLPVEAVTAQKRKKIIQTALLYLQKKGRLDSRCRFDVISILHSPGKPVKIDHLEGAFEAESPDG